MSKGKLKELLFDINENELSEIDENENLSIHDEFLLDAQELAKGEQKAADEDEFVPIPSPSERRQSERNRNRNAHNPNNKKNRKKKRQNEQLSRTRAFDVEEIEESEREKLSEGREMLEDMMAKGAVAAEQGLKTTKEAATKAGAIAKESIQDFSKKAAPHLRNLGEKSAEGASEISARFAQSVKNAKRSFKKGGIKQFAKDNIITLSIAMLVVVLGGGYYWYSYKNLPVLSKTHTENAGNDYKSYDADIHPMQILSTVRENMEDFRGAPDAKGDGKTPETKYVVYSLEWFGLRRKTVLFYGDNNQFTKIKLEIGNESATDLFAKLKAELGTPLEDENPTVRDGFATWIKDSILYKMTHRGTYSTVEMTKAVYENAPNLGITEPTFTIQYIKTIDLNSDGVVDEKILLIGNKAEGVTTNYKKLYLLVWDGTKTHLMEMDPEFDGGSFPQIRFADTDGDKTEEFVISAENNVVTNYNVFKLKDGSFTRIYSGYEDPIKK